MRWPFVVVVALALLVLPAGAGAATRIGPDLSVVQDGLGYGCQAAYSPCYYLNIDSSNSSVPVAATQNGVVTKWRFRAACCIPTQTSPKVMTLKTFRKGAQTAGGYSYFVPVADGPSFVIPVGNSVNSSPEVELPARLPIAANERIGIVADEPVSFASYNAANVTMTIGFTGYTYIGEYYGTPIGAALAINGEVEPDGDGDGYGDETQDCQPADPALHDGSCTPAPPTPVAPLPVAKPCPVGGCGGGPGGGAVFSGAPSQPVGPRSDGGVYVTLRCPSELTGNCGGILYAQLPDSLKKSSTSAVPRTLGRTSYSLKPGEKRKLQIKFSKSARKFLAKKRKRTITVTIQPDGGQPSSTNVTLKFKKKAKKRR